MKTILALVIAAVTLSAAPTTSYAQTERCRDAKGKFIKCPAPAAAPAARCKDAKGRFAKCGTPGANPV